MAIYDVKTRKNLKEKIKSLSAEGMNGRTIHSELSALGFKNTAGTGPVKLSHVYWVLKRKRRTATKTTAKTMAKPVRALSKVPVMILDILTNPELRDNQRLAMIRAYVEV